MSNNPVATADDAKADRIEMAVYRLDALANAVILRQGRESWEDLVLQAHKRIAEASIRSELRTFAFDVLSEVACYIPACQPGNVRSAMVGVIRALQRAIEESES